MQAAKPILDVARWGLTSYEEAHQRQQELLEKRLRGEIGDTLVLTEHESVITLGRGTPDEDAPSEGVSSAGAPAASSVPVIECERGGEATYHGPGQLVAYPIFLLPEGRRDLHRYLRDLEEVVIRCLAEVEVHGARRPGLTGVWIGDKKVCSVGVAVRRWVTWHGLALNIHTDLEAFQSFRPCGLDPQVMTRVADHAEIPPSTFLFQVLAIKHVCEVFNLELPPLPPPAPAEDANGILPIHPVQ